MEKNFKSLKNESEMKQTVKKNDKKDRFKVK